MLTPVYRCGVNCLKFRGNVFLDDSLVCTFDLMRFPTHAFGYSFMRKTQLLRSSFRHDSGSQLHLMRIFQTEAWKERSSPHRYPFNLQREFHNFHRRIVLNANSPRIHFLQLLWNLLTATIVGQLCIVKGLCDLVGVEHI